MKTVRSAGAAATHRFALSLYTLLVLLGLSAGCAESAPTVDENVGSTEDALSASLSPAVASIPANVDQQFTVKGKNPIWAVSDPTLASVTTTGLVTGLKPGVVTVSATVGKNVTTGTLTVTSATLDAIAVSPVKKTITMSTTGKGTKPLTFVATGRFQDGTSSKTFPLRAPTTVWASSDVAIATVSSSGVPTAVAPGDVEITATDAVTGLQGTAKLTVSGSEATSIQVTPLHPRAPVGTAQQLTATGAFDDKTVGDLTAPDIVWSAADPTIASVDDTGLVQAVGVGTTTIFATDVASGVSGSTSFTVTDATLTSIQVTVAGATTKTKTLGKTGFGGGPTKGPELSIGVSLALEATGIFGKSKFPLAPATTVWTSSDETLATVSSTGEVTCLSQTKGTVKIKATDTVTGLTGTLALTINAATLDHVEITDPGFLQPTTTARTQAKVPTFNLAVGVTQPFVLTAVYSNKQTLVMTDKAAWTSSAPTEALVSNSSGSAGEVTGIKAGTVKLTAKFETLQTTVKVIVSKAKVTAIAVTPVISTLPDGRTVELTATATYDDETIADVTHAVTWTSSTDSVFVSNAKRSSGLATATSPGTATIRAIDPLTKVTGSAWMTVTPAVLQELAIDPASVQLLEKKQQQNLVATGLFSDSTVKDLTKTVLWTSSDTDVATISNATKTAGRVVAVKVGTTTIGAFDPASGISAPDVVLTVAPLTLTALAITPASATIAAGFSRRFTATGTYNDGSKRNVTSLVTWSVPNGSATISNAAGSQGLASGQVVGTNTIQAVDADTGLIATATLNVTAAVLTSIAVTSATPSIAVGSTDQFTATGTFSDGTTQDLTTSVTWGASTGAAAISNVPGSSGLATGIAAGSTAVTATDPASGVSGSSTLTVTSSALVSIAVAPASITLVVGDTQQFVATGTYSDGSTADLTATATWSCSDVTVLPISSDPDSAGLATAIDSGEVFVSATDPTTGIAGSAEVFVTGPEHSAPQFQSDDSTTFLTATQPSMFQSFTVAATGVPPVTSITVAGTLPTGLTYDPSTGLLTGSPAAGTAGIYPLVFTADNGRFTGTQEFTLQVSGTMPDLTVPTVSSEPQDLTSGPDGNVWFTEYAGNNIAKVTTAGVFTEYAVPTAGSKPEGITAGPDGNVWFTEYAGNKIGRITMGGAITEYAVPTANCDPDEIALGPDGRLWFTEWNASKIGAITPAGVFTEYPLPASNSNPSGITAGPDGNVWFTEDSANKIGTVTPAGLITEYPIPTASSASFEITLGPDGNLWFTEYEAGTIAVITPAGVVTEYPLPTANVNSPRPIGIAAGPDGNLWVTDSNGGVIDRMGTDGTLTEFQTATFASEPFGITAGPDGNMWFTGVSVIGRAMP